ALMGRIYAPLSLSPVCSNDTAPTHLLTLSLHDALPISLPPVLPVDRAHVLDLVAVLRQLATHLVAEGGILGAEFEVHRSVLLTRSEEHTSELQSPSNLVCRLLLEKKKPHTSRQNRSDYM